MVNEHAKANASKANRSTLINGIISGIFAVSVTQPLQVIRTNMMIKYYNKKPMGFINTIKSTYTEEGIKGFYRSIYPTLLKSPINSGLYFYSLEFFKMFFKNSSVLNKNSQNSVSSGLARAFTCTAINPLLVIITRIEIVGFKEYSSAWNGFNTIYKEEGIRGYFKGLRVLLIKEIPTAAMFYPMYELSKKFFKDMGYSLYVQTSVSAFACNWVLAVLNNPLDVIRTRLQYLHYSKNEDHDYRGLFAAVRKIFHLEGFHGLFVGIIPRVIKRGIGSSIAWTIYEALQERTERLSKITHYI